jgi:hypothetical protein
VFATSTASYSQPDSIVVDGSVVYVGFGNGVAKDGSDGRSSTIVAYTTNGTVIRTFSVLGHNDGLRVDPATHLLWALQNEDANPALAVINPTNGAQTDYTFSAASHGGGYDDIVFLGGKTFISASNPSSDPNTGPAIVTGTLNGTQVDVAQVLAGNAVATDLLTGGTVSLNLQDPDSMIADPTGRLVLDNQDGQQLVFVANPGLPSQTVGSLPLSAVVDDTVFAGLTPSTLLVSDLEPGIVYQIHGPFAPGTAFSAANDAGFVGTLHEGTGDLTSIVTGFVDPRGMAFLPIPVPEPGPATALSAIGILYLIGRAGGKQRRSVTVQRAGELRK